MKYSIDPTATSVAPKSFISILRENPFLIFSIVAFLPLLVVEAVSWNTASERDELLEIATATDISVFVEGSNCRMQVAKNKLTERSLSSGPLSKGELAEIDKKCKDSESAALAAQQLENQKKALMLQ